MNETKKDQADRLLDHEYDGIREYDNRLPNWWLYTLYGSIIFSVFYWIVFHTLKVVPLPRGRYELEMIAAAEAQLKKMEGQEVTDETLALMSTVPARVEAGQQVFTQFCVVCHGQSGEGNVGPNLTDAYWLHGARPLQILHTVNNGVQEKGMAAWAGQLGPRRVQDVVSYVLTLKGKNVPGKAPQGDLVTAEDEAAAASAPADSTGGVPATPAAAPQGVPEAPAGVSPDPANPLEVPPGATGDLAPAAGGAGQAG